MENFEAFPELFALLHSCLSEPLMLVFVERSLCEHPDTRSFWQRRMLVYCESSHDNLPAFRDGDIRDGPVGGCHLCLAPLA